MKLGKWIIPGFTRKLLRNRRVKLLVCLVALTFLGLNCLLYVHAYRMTHFSGTGARIRPSRLPFLSLIYAGLTGIKVPRPVVSLRPEYLFLNCETVRIESPKNNCILDSWQIPGTKAGSAVIFFHGYAACKSAMVIEASHFARLGYTCLLVDFYGSGDSTGNGTTIGYKEADDVVAAFDFLKSRGYDRILLYGRSMGSAAILRATGSGRIDPARIIIENPFDYMLSTVANRVRTMKIPSFPAAYLLTFWGGIQNGFWAFGHNPVEYARGVKCPTLLMSGESDKWVLRKESEGIASALESHGKFVLFPDAGHMSLTRANWALWKESVTSFLDDERPGS